MSKELIEADMRRPFSPTSVVLAFCGLAVSAALHAPAAHARGVFPPALRAATTADKAAWEAAPALQGPLLSAHSLPLDNRIGRLKLLISRLIAEAVSRNDGLPPLSTQVSLVVQSLSPPLPLLATCCACPRGP